MIKVLKPSEAIKLKSYIGDDLYLRLHSSSHICVPLEGGAYFIKYRFCDIKDAPFKDELICIYCGGGDLIFVGDNVHCLKALNADTQETDPFRWLLDFFLTMTADDLDILNNLESSITELEDELLTAQLPVKSASSRIITLRRNLLHLKRYYEQLSLVTGVLRDNEAGAMPFDLVKHFASLDRRVEHLLSFVLNLREYVTQVREAYQAQIGIEQNQIMRIFTVITGIFLPLTLIVGWYGMNFDMPEYGWRFGYAYIIALSVLVCVLGFVLFRRKKWF
jgi:magnesium transporter